MKLLISCISMIILLEYITDKYKLLSPSFVLNEIAKYCISFWAWIGHSFAILSSFLVYLDFYLLVQAFSRLLTPLLIILKSPLLLVLEYINVALSFGQDHLIYLVYVGSVLIVISIAWIINRFLPIQWKTNINSTFKKWEQEYENSIIKINNKSIARCQ